MSPTSFTILKMFRSLIFTILCGFAAADTSSEMDQHWELWNQTHNKVYFHQIEELGRRQIWEENLEMINVHNLETSLGLHTYKLGMNHLGGNTTEEIAGSPTGTIVPSDLDRNPSDFIWVNTSLPDSLDWMDADLVIEVKKQGGCASCWAFSAARALEGQLKKSAGTLRSLSAQNLLDCSPKYGSNGCKGGFMTQAFHYVIENQGIDSDYSYPYTGKVSKDGCLQDGDERALKVAVANIGPISVAIDASSRKFAFYRHGVYQDDSCSHNVTHSMLAVGYGTQRGQDYWLLKNRSGVKYGDEGYIKMARNSQSQCGIADYACFPII
uniref:Cathepsin S n=1 Tax=Amphiprion ocellaris TaxID=80972 RepID=A0A3Q1CV56_AMPOC